MPVNSRSQARRARQALSHAIAYVKGDRRAEIVLTTALLEVAIETWDQQQRLQRRSVSEVMQHWCSRCADYIRHGAARARRLLEAC